MPAQSRSPSYFIRICNAKVQLISHNSKSTFLRMFFSKYEIQESGDEDDQADNGGDESGDKDCSGSNVFHNSYCLVVSAIADMVAEALDRCVEHLSRDNRTDTENHQAPLLPVDVQKKSCRKNEHCGKKMYPHVSLHKSVADSGHCIAKTLQQPLYATTIHKLFLHKYSTRD